MTQKETYQKVLDIVMNPCYNKDNLIARLAKEYPRIFLKLVDPTSANGLEAKVIEIHKQSGLIQAIKWYRSSIPHLGLAEAKRSVEEILARAGMSKYSIQ